MSKHTKGPWHVVLSDNATPFIQNECGDDWTDINDRSSRICHMPAEIMEDFNSMNNARLIAAAPELLDIVLDYVRWIEIGRRDADLYERAKAAIAKARGKP